MNAAKKKLGKALQYNWYLEHREWTYKNVVPCVFAEPYMEDKKTNDLPDYKFFTFAGEPKIIQVDFDRFYDHKRNLYDIEWNFIEGSIQYPSDKNRVFDKPRLLEELLDLSRKLSTGLKHVRTDFYIVNDRVYFGELTFYHEAGLGLFSPDSFAVEMGMFLEI